MKKRTPSATGYKVTKSDSTCRGFLFEVGKTYKHEGRIEMCDRGFHFCQKASHCFNYYDFDSANKVYEVESYGKVIHGDDKSVTEEIKIVRALTWPEVLTLVNTGKDNTGNRNSGDWNSGNRNSGDSNSGNWNSGNWNSGDSNSGDSNSGDRNSGDRNSGDSNSGDRNSGDRNSGNRNSGDWNSGNRNSGDSNSGYRNSGAFCIDANPVVWLFDMPTTMKVREWEESRCVRLMRQLLDPCIWVNSSLMTDKERADNPKHETTGGYLRKKGHYEMWADMWGNLDAEGKNVFTSLPNFDKDKFKQITGIDISERP